MSEAIFSRNPEQDSELMQRMLLKAYDGAVDICVMSGAIAPNIGTYSPEGMAEPHLFTVPVDSHKLTKLFFDDAPTVVLDSEKCFLQYATPRSLELGEESYGAVTLSMSGVFAGDIMVDLDIDIWKTDFKGVPIARGLMDTEYKKAGRIIDSEVFMQGDILGIDEVFGLRSHCEDLTADNLARFVRVIGSLYDA